ncbi:helix-turn-helix domain-containing protein [Streptomyces sp. SAJ15]|uniref:helix-turn-helix domain-containing protein n=1 Tax=Streptomyces sp. SAJ15 TaxID=2011095 RepID=UPI001184F139|nr:helix-turn-helix domain-containing protein [Streptomyces sp. SAJ15]TVL94071.1 AraC family transcriptional regulator [Streptomyces sp. SAJ15]
MTYREWPAVLPAGAVLWTRTVAADDVSRPVLPDGCTDLIWSDGDPTARLFVAGPDTRAHLPAAPRGSRYTGIRFAPGTGPAVLGVPAHELRDQRVPLDALWSAAEVRRLMERMALAHEDGGDGARGSDLGGAGVGRVLEAVAAERLRAADPPDPVLAAVVAGLRGGRAVAAVADAVGLSARQLHRRSLVAFGYGPKTLARVLRLNRALEAARGGTPYAEVAAAVGYADQAHLAREVRAFTGLPLGRLIGRPRPPSAAG